MQQGHGGHEEHAAPPEVLLQVGDALLQQRDVLQGLGVRVQEDVQAAR